MQIFKPTLEGIFLERPNRFLARVRCGRRIITAHCPNPGRMVELLAPGRPVILERTADAKRKTPYTLVAVYYQTKVIPLYAARANHLAAGLIIPRLYPEASQVLPEQVYSHSRFDFKLVTPGREFFLEVKACTLVEHGVCMFPDAPTSRGRRHLYELAEVRGSVLFVLHHPDARCFVPNLHLDPEFSLGLLQVADKINIHCVSIRTDAGGNAELVDPAVPVILGPVENVVRDRGSYMLIICLKQPETIQVGALGEIDFIPGYYIYTGSALQHLSDRLARHRRKRKPLHWHIDYLTSRAKSIQPLPIYADHNLECRLAAALSRCAEYGIAGFGCSDCKCQSHLFYFKLPPWEVTAFREVLFRSRHSWALDLNNEK